jgi:hypothetical protein
VKRGYAVTSVMRRCRPGAVLLLAFWISALTACAEPAPTAVVRAGLRNLKCPSGEGEMMLTRETPKVREYVVACDFRYTRVLCDAAGCRGAPPKPPCSRSTCFEEDPVTLEWRPKGKPERRGDSGATAAATR